MIDGKRYWFEHELGENSILGRALRYEQDRTRELPFEEDARILLYMCEDKPHKAIKYVSETCEKVAAQARESSQSQLAHALTLLREVVCPSDGSPSRQVATWLLAQEEALDFLKKMGALTPQKESGDV